MLGLLSAAPDFALRTASLIFSTDAFDDFNKGTPLSEARTCGAPAFCVTPLDMAR